MSWYALETLDDSLDATKRLLFPFSVKRWLVLAIVAFFVGGSGGANVNPGNPSGTILPFQWTNAVTGNGPPGLLEPGFLTNGTGPIVVVLGALGVLLVAFAMLLVRAIMEFVFVEILRTRDVRIRGFFGDYTRPGFSLFAFWVGIGFVVLATMLTFVALTVLTAGVFLLVALLFSPILVVLAVGIWVVLRFTVDFVVPVMIADGSGIVDGWRSFWSPLVSEWEQYGFYAFVRFLLGVASTVVIGIGFATVALVLAIPFGIVGFGGIFVLITLLDFQFLGTVYGFVVLLVFVLSVIVAGTTLILVPVQTYLRYYGLFVLGAITPRYDLVAEVTRAADDKPAEFANGP